MAKYLLMNCRKIYVIQENEILTQLLYPLLFNGFSVPIKMDSKNRYPHIWSCMFRMCFWRKHQFQFRAYIRFEDDWLLKIEAFSKAERISTISHIGYYWRVNMQSETYIPHYIAHLGVKQQNCYEDMRHSISYKVQDPKVLEFFQQVTFCKQYLEAIHNFANLKQIPSIGNCEFASAICLSVYYYNEQNDLIKIKNAF